MACIRSFCFLFVMFVAMFLATQIAHPEEAPKTRPVGSADADQLDSDLDVSSAMLLEELQDAAFEHYVDLRLIGQAWREMDPALLTDVALQLAEGERVLLRSHRAISADDMLKLAIRAAQSKKDKEALQRLTKAVEGRNEALNSQVAAAKALLDSSRGEKPVTLRVDTSLDVFTLYKLVADEIARARIRGDGVMLDNLTVALKEMDIFEDHHISDLKTLIAKAQNYVEPESGSSANSGLVQTLDHFASISGDVGQIEEEPPQAPTSAANAFVGLPELNSRGDDYAENRLPQHIQQLLQSSSRGYETNKFDLKGRVESGGWKVAWADDISETDVLRGVVAVGVSIYAGNPGPFYAWIEHLIDRTIRSLAGSAANRFPAAVERQARQLAADVIKQAIRGRSAREVFRRYDTVDFKAGAIRYSGRNVQRVWNPIKWKHEEITLSRTWGLKPYVAFRWRGSAGGAGSGGSSQVRFRYTIRNEAGRTVRFRLPSGRWYTLRPRQTGSYRYTGLRSSAKAYIPNSKSGTYLLSAGRWHIIPLGSNRVGFGKW